MQSPGGTCTIFLIQYCLDAWLTKHFVCAAMGVNTQVGLHMGLGKYGFLTPHSLQIFLPHSSHYILKKCSRLTFYKLTFPHLTFYKHFF